MKHRGFTLVEILTMLVIIAGLAAILFPVLAASKKTAKLSACSENLKQIGMALALYANDHDDHLPVEVEPAMLVAINGGHTSLGEPWKRILLNSPHWPTAIFSYGVHKANVQCPLDAPRITDGDPEPSAFVQYGTSYGYDDLAALVYHSFSAIPNPSSESLSYDFGPSVHGGDGANGLINCMHGDLHVKQTTSVDCTQNRTPIPG